MYALKPTEPERKGKALPKLWEIGSALTELEGVIADILDAEDLTEVEKDVRAAYALNEWLQAGANFDEKAAQVAAFIRHIEAVAEARKEESRRLRELAAQAENRASALRRYLTNEMVRTSRTKIEGVNAFDLGAEEAAEAHPPLPPRRVARPIRARHLRTLPHRDPQGTQGAARNTVGIVEQRGRV